VVLLSVRSRPPDPKHIKSLMTCALSSSLTPGDAASVAPQQQCPILVNACGNSANDQCARRSNRGLRFSDDGSARTNRLKEISGAKRHGRRFPTIKRWLATRRHLGRSKTVPANMGTSLPRRRHQFAGAPPPSITCECRQNRRRRRTSGVTSRVISVIAAFENTDILRHAGHQVKLLGDILDFAAVLGRW